MNKISKYFSSGLLAMVLAFLVASPALAATITPNPVDQGDPITSLSGLVGGGSSGRVYYQKPSETSTGTYGIANGGDSMMHDIGYGTAGDIITNEIGTYYLWEFTDLLTSEEQNNISDAEKMALPSYVTRTTFVVQAVGGGTSDTEAIAAEMAAKVKEDMFAGLATVAPYMVVVGVGFWVVRFGYRKIAGKAH